MLHFFPTYFFFEVQATSECWQVERELRDVSINKISHELTLWKLVDGCVGYCIFSKLEAPWGPGVTLSLALVPRAVLCTQSGCPARKGCDMLGTIPGLQSSLLGFSNPTYKVAAVFQALLSASPVLNACHTWSHWSLAASECWEPILQKGSRSSDKLCYLSGLAQ